MTTMQLPFYDGLQTKPPHKAEDIAHLRQWLTCQTHLPQQISDDYLHLFFHSNYCKLEKTKQTIESYYAIRTNSELFSKWDPNSAPIQKMLNSSSMIVSSRKTPEGYTLLIYRLTDFEASKFDFPTGMKMFFMFNDMVLSEEGLSPGFVVILDMKGVSLGHLSTVNLSSIRVFMNYIQDAHPARLKGVHVINSVSFIDKLLLMVKPFIKGELMSLLHFHGPPESISKFHPIDCLPNDYNGGKAEETSVSAAKYRKMMETRYAKFFEEENKLRIEDGKKSKKGKMHVTEGSFRSLSID